MAGASGAIKQHSSNNNCGLMTGSGWGGQQYNFNAASVNNRYGNYTEVNPLYDSCKFIIQY